jgi:hypothetical protein
MEVSWEAFVRLAQSDPTVSLAMVRNLGAQFRKAAADSAA